MPSKERIKKIAQYTRSSKARLDDGVTILDGLHVVEEAYNRGKKNNLTEILYTEKSVCNPEIKDFLSSADPKIISRVSETVMLRLASTKTPAGILGVYKIPPSPKKLNPEAKTILLLDRIADPGNLGTIIRTGVSLGVDAFFCSPGCADAWSPKVLRAAQGAHFYTDIFLKADFTTIKEHFDGTIIGTFLDPDATSLYKTDLSGKVAFVVGNEGAGISPEEFAVYGNKKIHIPMDAEFESLNVALATGIVLAENRRQNLSH